MKTCPIAILRDVTIGVALATGIGVAANIHALDASAPEGGAPILIDPQTEGYSEIGIVPSGSELIVFSGQIGSDANGDLPDDLAEQYRKAVANVMRLLHAQHVPLRNVVKLNTYIVASADATRLRGVHTAFDAIKPTATLVFVSRLAHPKAMVELEVLASRAPMAQTQGLIPPRDFGQ